MTKPVPSTTMSALLSGMTALDAELAFRVLAYRESLPAGLAGSYVGLTGADRCLQIGILSDMLGWQALARAHELDPVLGRQRIVEASSELVARVARAFCARCADERALTVGLPLFVEGGIVLDLRLDVQAADIVLGSTRALVVLLAPRAPLAAATSGGHAPGGAAEKEPRR